MKELKIKRAGIIKIFLGSLVLVQAFSLAIFAQKAKPRTTVPAKTAPAKTTPVKPATQPVAAKTVAKDPNLPEVTQIDAVALEKLLKPNGKPVLINFWATWCAPCVEEFPEFVKINTDYKEKLDIVAISLDDPPELTRGVPQFLLKVKSNIPAYLLKAVDEDAAMKSVDKSWEGGLPFTILINADGTVAYTQQGKIKPETIREKIDQSIVK